MASVVAMAGDDVVMPENAMMMILDPSGVVIGTSKEMRELAAALEKIKQSMISAYAAKSSADREEIGRLMAEETWLTVEEAVELNLADGIDEPVRMAANFDLSRFRHPPTGLTARNPKERGMTGTSTQSQQPTTEPTPQPSAAPTPQQQPANGPAPQPAAEDQPAASLSATERNQIVAAERRRASDIHAACSLVRTVGGVSRARAARVHARRRGPG